MAENPDSDSRDGSGGRTPGGRSEKKKAGQGRGKRRSSGRGERSRSESDAAFPIVAIGASAGGLEAIQQIAGRLEPGLGMAFILIQHLDPNHESAIPAILSRASRVEVIEAENDQEILPDHIYTIPSDKKASVAGGRLSLEPHDRTRVPMPIDYFLESLATDQKERAIAVILSGGGTDGTLGVKAIKEHGGITLAQDDSAEHRHMPRSAIASGFVDKALDPDQIASELIRLSQEPYLKKPSESVSGDGDRAALERIFRILDKREGIDFSEYKGATTTRRIRRRMTLSRVATLGEYAAYLENHPDEVHDLAQDMLIRVTGFFRDPAVFDYLESSILPKMIEEHDQNHPLRLWVPGCATGEEVYSLAMLIDDYIPESGSEVDFQIFGTDVSERSIEFARNGIYPENIIQVLKPQQVQRHFTKLDGYYKIRRDLRDRCVFARQDLTKDPPFSRLDLVSCRNVLIYLDARMQRRVFSILQYALRQGGILLLGTSETPTASAEPFEPVHRKFHVYRKGSDEGRLPSDLVRWDVDSVSYPDRSSGSPADRERTLIEETDYVVLHKLAPPAVLVNDDLDVVQFRGRTSRFLEPPPGAPTFNLMKMVRQGLMAELRTGIALAKKSGKTVTRDSVRVQLDEAETSVDLEIVPIRADVKDRHFLIVFKEVPAKPETERPEQSRNTPRLKRELEATREYLQSIIEEQEAMNEELRSANEEIQSSNEELQSTNEELETAKEELQSTNEELTTLNEELTIRNQELDQLNNDLANILTSVEIPIIILSSDMTIRRINPAAQTTLGLIPADVGRPVSDMRASMEIDRLEDTARQVIDTLKLREIDLTTRDGRNHHLQIRPYKTLDNRIDGVVLVFLEERTEESG